MLLALTKKQLGVKIHVVPMQRVPSHVGVQGNERTDEGAVRGLVQAVKEVPRDREVSDIWHDFEVAEMDDPRNDKMSGGHVAVMCHIVQSQHAVQMRNSTVKPVIHQTSCWMCPRVTETHRVMREGGELTPWCALFEHVSEQWRAAVQLDNL